MFENENNREVDTGYFLSKVEVKYLNVMINWKKLFDTIGFENLQVVKEILRQLLAY